uniref:AlNc14C40G3401 protein n=1 Tax=Albugo laibachii Nc14 TaxID=890382 RepID=F0W9E2_9STRA|nr:AlNc14C40G3401 [Albugo laibachii Nc14]|eukprot:CCA17756.1 AlNc14C40G3401 [Albugo laibachii Nc14]
MSISRTQPTALAFNATLHRDPDILDLYQQAITNALVSPTPDVELDWPSILNRIKDIGNTIIRPTYPNAQRHDHNDEIAQLSHVQNCLRLLLTSSNDPVDLLLYRSRRQVFLRTIR